MTWKDLKLIVDGMSEEQLNQEVVYLEGYDDKLIMPVDLEWAEVVIEDSTGDTIEVGQFYFE